MGLREVLQARAAFQGRTAEVACGELGVLTVEALPLQEAEALSRGADADRAVFYAACRELQAEGDAMHRAGKLYAPDGIMRFVSDDEAAAAARVVLELSGLRRNESTENGEGRLPEEPEEGGDAVGTAAVSEEVRSGTEAEARTAVFLAAAEPQEGPPGGEALSAPVLQEQAADRERDSLAKPVVSALAEEVSLAEETAAEAGPFAEADIRPDGLLRRPAGGYESVEIPQQTIPAAAAAAETVWITREARDTEAPAELRRDPAFDRRQSHALLQDPEERFARQLLEGLRRAKWVRGE